MNSSQDVSRVNVSELEVRIIFNQANDTLHNENVDYYREKASEVYDVPYDEITDEQRRVAKELYWFNQYTIGIGGSMGFRNN